jgi:hypothetical protein
MTRPRVTLVSLILVLALPALVAAQGAAWRVPGDFAT